MSKTDIQQMEVIILAEEWDKLAKKHNTFSEILDISIKGNPDIKFDEIMIQLALWLGVENEDKIEWLKAAIKKVATLDNQTTIKWCDINPDLSINYENNKHYWQERVRITKARIQTDMELSLLKDIIPAMS